MNTTGQTAINFERPVLSRKEIQRRVIEGLDKSFSTSTTLTLYLRACERLLRESRSAQAEQDYEQAYFILLRLVELIVNYIPRHPEAKDPSYAARIKALKRRTPNLLAELDEMKGKLDHDYEQFKQQERVTLENRAKQSAEIRAKRRQSEKEHEERAKLQEVRQTTSQKTPQDLQKRLQALNIGNDVPVSKFEEPQNMQARPTSYEYPELLPRQINGQTSPISFSLPRRLTSPQGVVNQPSSPEPREVSADSTKQEHYFTSSASLENDYPLKTVFLPSSLRSTFLQLASDNTRKNLETCGILSGTLRNNAYFITTLLVPAQESTSDTCHTTDEEGLFNYQDQNDLFTLGWIHTHPTQTCFLSSVDLHTHCNYQLMLSEAIAIVCAPSKDPSHGIFRLTDPPGVTVVKTCRQTGLFHPHEEDRIYTDASAKSNAGHVKEVDGMKFTVEDQRQ